MFLIYQSVRILTKLHGLGFADKDLKVTKKLHDNKSWEALLRQPQEVTDERKFHYLNSHMLLGSMTFDALRLGKDFSENRIYYDYPSQATHSRG